MSISVTKTVAKLLSSTQKRPTSSPASVYPVQPDVVLKKLPFYILEDVLLKPSSLQPSGGNKLNDQTFMFSLSPGQAKKVTGSRLPAVSGRLEYRHQVQLRLSLLQTTAEQPDNFPRSLCVKVGLQCVSTVCTVFVLRSMVRSAPCPTLCPASPARSPDVPQAPSTSHTLSS